MLQEQSMSEHIRRLRRTTCNQCIHCASFSHESVDHHLSLEYSMCLAILLHTYMVLHQRRMMLHHKELQIWETVEQIRRNSQCLRMSLLPL